MCNGGSADGLFDYRICLKTSFAPAQLLYHYRCIFTIIITWQQLLLQGHQQHFQTYLFPAID